MGMCSLCVARRPPKMQKLQQETKHERSGGSRQIGGEWWIQWCLSFLGSRAGREGSARFLDEG